MLQVRASPAAWFRFALAVAIMRFLSRAPGIRLMDTCKDGQIRNYFNPCVKGGKQNAISCALARL
jgi:hypothetical protein